MTVSRAIVERLTADQRTLLKTTLEELVGADLEAIADLLVARVFPPGADTARVIDPAGEIDAFVEILLHELRFVARVPGWKLATRDARARAAIGEAGF
jgi:hypothetical protein